MSADLLRMQKALFIQSQKIISWPTVSYWTCFPFFIGPLVQNIYSLSLYQDHTLRTYSECILGSLPFSLSVSRIFSCCISHGLLPRQKPIKHPSHMLLHVPVFLAGSSNHLGFQTLGQRNLIVSFLHFFQNAVLILVSPFQLR